MCVDQLETVKKSFSKYTPCMTMNGELKLFLVDGLIQDQPRHLKLIKDIEKLGYLFKTEVYDIAGYYIAYFKINQKGA